MYAERYGPQGYNRGSLGLSVGIVGGLLAAAFLVSPVVKHFDPGHILKVYPVAPETPPPPPNPVPPKVQPKAPPSQPVDTPKVLVPTDPPVINDYPPPPPLPPAPPTIGEGTGTGSGTVELAKVPPVLTPAGVDDRYARDFQPPYPAAEERAGREGVVTVRVLIGVDGRVKQIEQLAAASDEFWRVTQHQALGRWRFTPATRDGVPVEQWKTMTVRFRLQE